MPPKTGSGKTFENILATALKTSGYGFCRQVRVPGALAGRQHVLDFVVTQPKQVLISVKWQGTSGTTEEKIPFEVIRLSDLIRRGNITAFCQKDQITLSAQKAYIVLAGNGWSLKDWYVKGGLHEFLPGCSNIRILDFYDFMNMVNSRSI
ncbi:hypothetical protein DV704_05100 [Meiothermus sp. QL-1]|uniref:PD-(D/E)XK nuclease superfamily protein n=1 Tax=Meiothermus sp. QL-1 TaxID=2058095 RepID=UPI000E0B8862|nr:PD-(D/E)XK nuclease superfamily protein [Meiothermus sp. QL-1]RDI95657.1 hypothetical protein DV704_05100 [Meiothermus sp. QL-1]